MEPLQCNCKVGTHHSCTAFHKAHASALWRQGLAAGIRICKHALVVTHVRGAGVLTVYDPTLSACAIGSGCLTSNPSACLLCGNTVAVSRQAVAWVLCELPMRAVQILLSAITVAADSSNCGVRFLRAGMHALTLLSATTVAVSNLGISADTLSARVNAPALLRAIVVTTRRHGNGAGTLRARVNALSALSTTAVTVSRPGGGAGTLRARMHLMLAVRRFGSARVPCELACTSF